MRLLFYTHPALFEPALCLVRELSRRTELHLVLEISPGSWHTAGFDVGEQPVASGLVAADDVLTNRLPGAVRAYWQSVASFHLAVHSTRRSVHPRSWAIGRSVLAFARQQHVDVLHIDDVDVSPRLALALPGAKPLPTIIAVHDPEPHSGERNWRKRLARALAYPRADRFILYNTALEAAFAQHYPVARGKTGTARLGAYDILTEWPSDPALPGTSTVLFFGRLSPYKGLDVFYDAARLVAARVPGVRFVVAGRPVPGYTVPDPPRLAAGEIDLRARYISNEETASLFREAAVVVCPYRDATQSGVVLTAFAFGVPVVASNAGGLPEYVISGQTGIVVPIGDAAATADAICTILRDRAYGASLTANIASARNTFLSWRETADRVLEIYGGARSA